MVSIEHYTSRQNWWRIDNVDGMLDPRSEPFPIRGMGISERVREITKSKEYVVGVLEGSRGVWDEHDLLGIVMGDKPREVRLSFSLSELEGVLVRERIYYSEEYINERFGPDFPRLHLRSFRSFISRDRKRMKEIDSMYVESTVRWAGYNGKYSTPEIWIPYGIPRDKIKAEVLESLSGD